MNHSKFLSGFTASLVAATTTFSAVAVAQDTANQGYVIEEVQVTAQRRTERALDVPISITALGAEQLGKGDVLQLGDIAKLTPGMRFDAQGGNAQPTIRGVGSSVVMAGAGSNIAIYTDGFYTPNPMMADTELLNIESVQVLKGPQGTLFGRNSTGGAILVTSSDPSSEASGSLQASYGSYNAQRYQAYVTGGPSDKLAFDLAALFRNGDGYLENTVTGDDEVGKFRNWSARFGVLFQPTDKTSVLFRYSQSEVDDPSVTSVNFFDVDRYSAAGLRGVPASDEANELTNNYPFGYTFESESFQLRVKIDLDFAAFTSYTQYRDEEGIHDYDFDASPQDASHYHFETTDKIFTQEFLLSSQSDGPLQWATGLFYMRDKTIYPNNQAATEYSIPFFALPFALRPSGGTGIKASSVAIFADATYEVLDRLFFTLGARYSEDKLDNAYYISTTTGLKTPVEDVDDDKVTPRVAVRYEMTDNSSIYTSYTEGFKSSMINLAGSNLLGSLITDLNVDQEEIQAYEIGYKYSDGRLLLDAALFYYDYKDLQQVSYVGYDTLVNNADASIYGVDIQSRYAVTDRLEVSLGLAWLDTEYDNYEDAQTWTQCTNPAGCNPFFPLPEDYGTFTPGYTDGSGNEILRSPELTATLGAAYRMDLAGGSSLDFSGTLYYTSDFYFDAVNTYQQDSYHLLSLRAEWTDASDTYTVALFGDNLTDEEYVSSLLPQFYGALATWGAPRTVGISGEFRF